MTHFSPTLALLHAIRLRVCALTHTSNLILRLQLWFAEWDYADRYRECCGIYGDSYAHRALVEAASHVAVLRQRFESRS